MGELHYEEITRSGCEDFRKERDEERASDALRYCPACGTSYKGSEEEGGDVEQEHPQGEADEAAGEALPYEEPAHIDAYACNDHGMDAASEADNLQYSC